MNNEIVDIDINYFESPEFLQADTFKVSSVAYIGDGGDIAELCLQPHRPLESVRWIGGFYTIFGTQPFVNRDGNLKTLHVPWVDYGKEKYHDYIVINTHNRKTRYLDSEEFNRNNERGPNDHLIKVIKVEPHKLKHNTVEKAIYEKILKNERLREQDESETNLS